MRQNNKKTQKSQPKEPNPRIVMLKKFNENKRAQSFAEAKERNFTY